MSLINCPECKKEISSKAESCPNCGYNLKKENVKKNMKKIAIGCLTIFIIFFIMAIVVGILNPDNKKVSEVSSAKTIKKEEEHSLEYKLAVINEGGYVKDDDIKIARFRFLLDNLQKKYVENEQKIADVSVYTINELKKIGLKESLINVMEGMNNVMPVEIGNQKYSEYAAMYLTLRTDGQTHKEAIMGIKAILKSLGVQY